MISVDRLMLAEFARLELTDAAYADTPVSMVDVPLVLLLLFVRTEFVV